MSITLVFGGQILIARVGGKEAYGTFSQVFNWIGVLFVVAMFGADTLLVKQIPIYQTQKDKSLIKGVFKWTQRRILGVSLSLIALFFILVNCFEIAGLSNNAYYFNISLITILLGAFMMGNQAYLRGLGKVVLGSTAEKLVKPLGMILAILLFTILGKAEEVESYVWANVIAFFLAFLYAAFLVQRHKSSMASSLVSSKDEKDWWQRSKQFTLAGVLFMLTARMDVLAIGSSLGNTEAGFYNVALKYAEMAFLPYFIISHSIAPMYSKLQAENKTKELQALFKNATRIIFVITLLVVLFFIFGGEFILSFFGQDYKIAYHTLLILALGKLVASFIGPVNTLMMMLGVEKMVNYSLFFQVCLMALGLFFFLPLWGMEGAALATCTGLILAQSCMAVLLYRKTGFKATIF